MKAIKYVVYALFIGVLIFATLQIFKGNAQIGLLEKEVTHISSIATTDAGRASDYSATSVANSATSVAYSATSVSFISTQGAQATLGAANLKQDNAILDKEIEELKKDLATVDCEFKPESINYTSNDTVHADLKLWVDNFYFGDINNNNSEWYTIWTQTDIAEHDIILSDGSYFPYIVFFDETRYGYTNAVFDIDQECWLDR